nr:MAG TPA: hypothetical protein [Caudoviricetes sp.]
MLLFYNRIHYITTNFHRLNLFFYDFFRHFFMFFDVVSHNLVDVFVNII